MGYLYGALMYTRNQAKVSISTRINAISEEL